MSGFKKRRNPITGLTRIEKRICDQVVKNPGYSASRAAEAAGAKRPREQGPNTVKLPAAQRYMASLMERHENLRDSSLCAKLSKELEKTKTEFAQRGGRFTDKVEVPDNIHQAKMLELAFKLKGMLQPDPSEAGAVYLDMRSVINIVRQSAQERGVR